MHPKSLHLSMDGCSMEYGCSKTVFEYLSMDAVAECTACCPPHRLIMIHGRNGAAEKLDQNIPIDRKDGRCTQLRSTELHTFVNSTPVTTTSTSAPTTTSRRHLVLNINTKNFKKNTSISIDRKDIPSHWWWCSFCPPSNSPPVERRLCFRFSDPLHLGSDAYQFFYQTGSRVMLLLCWCLVHR